MAKLDSCLASLNQELHSLFERDGRVVLVGEDVKDPYGGAFKVSRGLSDRYPDRVFSTPICEASIVGIGVGMALRGMRPICEIMFGDFITIAADQIINHAVKLGPMYGKEGSSLPIIIRTPMGGGRGYGPTHSQSLEKFFLGVPGLTVLAMNHFHAPGNDLRTAYDIARPVLFIENKLLYSKRLFVNGEGGVSVEFVNHSGFNVSLVRNFRPEEHIPDVLLLCYGGSSRFVENVLSYFATEEIWVEAIIPSCINHHPMELVLERATVTRKVVVCEEGTAGYGWGQDLASMIYSNLYSSLEHPIVTLASEPGVIPANVEEEQAMLLNEPKIIGAITRMFE